MNPAIRRNERAQRHLAKLMLAVCVAVALTATLQWTATVSADRAALTLTFTQQPAVTQAGQVISPPVTVLVQDDTGKAIQNTSVSIAIGSNPVGGTLSGTKTRTTNKSGVATFNDLSIDKAAPGYTLVATSGAVSKVSDSFTIATVLKKCGTSCSATATPADGKSSTTVIAAGADSTSSLALTLLNPATFPPPAGLCSGFIPLGTGSTILVLASSTTPTKTITWRLDKSIVNQQPDNAASHFDICLGARNTSNPAATFPTKDGGSASFDPQSGLFWGLLPACAAGTPANPCIQSRHKTNAGDVVITFIVPAPWDEDYYGG